MRKFILMTVFFAFANTSVEAQRTQAGIYHQAKYEITHVVKKGETLSEIAEYYATSSSALISYNDNLIANKIKPGQVILVPSTFDINYIKNVLEIPEYRFKLILNNEEENLYFDAGENGVKNTPEENGPNYVAGEVIKPKSKPRPKGAMTKKEYEAMQRGEIPASDNTNNSTTTETVNTKPANTSYEQPNTGTETVTNTTNYTSKPVDSSVANIQNADKILHLVKTGETLYSISKKYNVTIEQLKAWNNIQSNQQLPLSENIIVGIKAIETQPTIERPTVQPKPANPNDVKFHVVKQGETLYSIAKSYNMDIESLRKLNKLNNNDISVGQQIMIPAALIDNGTGSIEQRPSNSDNIVEESAPILTASTGGVDVILTGGTSPSELPPSEFNAPLGTKQILHEVQTSETLFRIAKQYNLEISQLRQMNNFPADFTAISPGDQLIIGYAKETGAVTEDYNYELSNEIVASTPAAKNQMEKFKRAYEIKDGLATYEKQFDTGVGTWDRKDETQKNNLYVLHKTAPINSIIEIVNPMNNAKIYVKVIGKFEPLIGQENVEVKLSTEAVRRLRLLDDQFRLKMKYHVKR